MTTAQRPRLGIGTPPTAEAAAPVPVEVTRKADRFPSAPAVPTARPLPEARAVPIACVAPKARRYALVKRCVDAVVAGVALVVLAPAIAVVWVVVLVFLGRPALFLQERVTVGEKRFRLLKFRTMLPVDSGRGWVTDDDRLTPFGAWLRASSLDELPSLWNIFVGDMSIVGPRPLPSRYLSIYSPAQRGRHTVRAGLTGLAQVSGRNNVPWDLRFDLDQRYVLLMGPLIDLTIIVRTVRTVLSRDGVAEGDLVTSTEFSGPLRTPHLRFVPCTDGSELTQQMWEARTPEDTLVAMCGFVRRKGTESESGSGEIIAELFVGGIDHAVGPILAADVVTLLVSRARAADCTHVRIQVPTSGVDLTRAFHEAGFQQITNDGFLTADIRCVDDPLTAGAGQ